MHQALLPELCRGKSRVLFKSGVEGRFGIEAGLQADGKNGVVFVSSVGEHMLCFEYPVRINVIGKVLSAQPIDQLGEIGNANVQGIGHTAQAQVGIAVHLPMYQKSGQLVVVDRPIDQWPFVLRKYPIQFDGDQLGY